MPTALPRHRRLATLAVVLLATAACGGLDEAELVGPDQVVELDVGQLRVLRHVDDPDAGEEWIDVVDGAPEVVERTGRFREDAAGRIAEDDEPADVRTLVTGVADGQALLVRMDCTGCVDGVPRTAPDADLVVWDLRVGSAGPLVVGDGVAVDGETTTLAVGEHVTVVRPAAEGDGTVDVGDDPVVTPVARRDIADGGDLLLDVFAATTPGRGEIVVTAAGGTVHRYPVQVTAG